MPRSRISTRRWRWPWGWALVFVGAAVVLSAGLARNSHSADPPAFQRSLRVVVAPFAATEGYERRGRFVGRVEFAREAELAFELGGRVLRVLVDEGDEVAAGDVLAELDTERLRAQRVEHVAEQAQARAERDLARLRDGRAQRLVSEDVISPQDGDDTRLALAARESALARVGARIERIDVDLAKSTLRAPFAGRVASRAVDEGVVVDAAVPVLRLLETGRPEVRVGVPRHVAATLVEGEWREVEIGGRVHPARVRSVLPERGERTRTVAVLLTLTPGGDGLRSGDLAELRWREPVPSAGAWLPRAALTEGARGLWAAYVAAPEDDDAAGGHRLERRPVELLHEEGDRVFVRGALRDGERVVQRGVHRLVPGQRVELARDGEEDAG